MARKVGQIDRIGHDYKVVLPNGPDLDRVPPFLISVSQGSSHCSLWLQLSLWLPWPFPDSITVSISISPS